MKNFLYLKSIKAAISLALVLLTYNGDAQNQITMTMSGASNITSTSFEFDILLASTGPSAGTVIIKLAAAAPQIFQSPVNIPVSPIPTYAVLFEGPTFVPLNDPTGTYNNNTFRIAQSPVLVNSAAVPIPTSPTVFAHVKITSNAGAITYPVTLKFRTGTPNTTMAAFLDAATTTTTFSLAAGNLVNGPDLIISGPAPLELNSFSGKTMSKTNMLFWETAQERNVNTHIIERSAEGEKWTEIGRKAGQVISNGATKYELEDLAPIAKAYYRLRSVDFDAKEQISNVIQLTRRDQQFGINAAFPSPTTDKVLVQFTAQKEGDVTLQVTDLVGRVVLAQNFAAADGVNSTEVSLATLPAGTYILTVVNDTQATEPVRVVKQ